ncbi:hypothetical protein EGW08_001910, partial [Elysia chlorotica]
MFPNTTTTRSFPFFMRRDRFQEFRGDFREAVTNATERLAQLVREEIQSSQLAELIYTLLNSDLIRDFLQALDISVIPVQTTTATMATIPRNVTMATTQKDTIPRNVTGFSPTSETIIESVPSDSEPVPRAMAQTAIQVLQTADLTDPESIVSTTGQILLDNARQTIQDEVLSDPVAFLRNILDVVSRNNSLLARIIPQETITAITDGIGPVIQATQFASSLAQ